MENSSTLSYFKPRQAIIVLDFNIDAIVDALNFSSYIHGMGEEDLLALICSFLYKSEQESTYNFMAFCHKCIIVSQEQGTIDYDLYILKSIERQIHSILDVIKTYNLKFPIVFDRKYDDKSFIIKEMTHDDIT